jgi:lambda family phage tail tape measure protein
MNVALKITAGVTGQQAVDQLRTSMDRMKDSVDGVSNRFGMLKGALAGLAGTAVVAGFVGMIKSAIDMGDKLNDLRQKTGIAVEDLDALGYAAELNGSNLDAVSGALGKLAKNMADAAGGSKDAIATFKQFGINQADLKNGTITTTEAMARIADRLSTMEDGWQKTAAAQQVFGKSAADLVPLLNAGGGAIRDARTELEAMGALFTGSMAQAADEFNDNMSKLRRMATALGLSLAQELMPVLNGFVLGIIDAKSKSDDLSGSTALSDWATVAAKGIAILVDVARVAAQAIYALVGSFQAVWADITLAGTFLKDGPTALFRHGGVEALKQALNERNQVVADANQRYAKLWNMDGSQVLNAVTSAIEKQKNAVKPIAGPKPATGFKFDFGAGKETEYDKLLQQMNEQLAKTGEMTKSEELLRLFQTERYKDLTSAQKAELLRLANLIEMRQEHDKNVKDAAKADEDASKARTQQLLTEWDAVSKLKDSKADELAMLQLEAQAVNMTTDEYDARVRKLEHERSVRDAIRGMLPETAAAYRDVADAAFQASENQRRINAGADQLYETGAKRAIKSYAAELNNVAKATEDAFGRAFQGMEDALVTFVTTGKSTFGDLARSILADIARIAVRQAIVKPLMSAFGFGFADGGIMTSGGPMPLKTYANGGIATSPQVAVFGEGKMPEAYVPLPDGRTIPVTMKGEGGGSTSVVVNVNVESGQSQVKDDKGAGDLGRVIAGAVKAELINQKRPGGLLAA